MQNCIHISPTFAVAGFSKGLTSKDFIAVVVKLQSLILLHTLGFINHLSLYYRKQGAHAKLQSSIEKKYVCEEMKPFLYEHDQTCEEEGGALCVGEKDALYEEERSTLCVGEKDALYEEERSALCVGEKDALYEEERSTLCVGMVSHMYAQSPTEGTKVTKHKEEGGEIKLTKVLIATNGAAMFLLPHQPLPSM